MSRILDRLQISKGQNAGEPGVGDTRKLTVATSVVGEDADRDLSVLDLILGSLAFRVETLLSIKMFILVRFS